MRRLLLFGAGRSSGYFINFLKTRSTEIQISVIDSDKKKLIRLSENYPNIKTLQLNINDIYHVRDAVKNNDLIVSLLPAYLHHAIAQLCLEESKNFACASYYSSQYDQLILEAKKKGLLFLFECGLDPGIDHMSAAKEIDLLRQKGYKIKEFESFTGGLLNTASELNNPWKYKFTWNPRNVVLAGNGVVKFKQKNKIKFIPAHRVFRRSEILEIPGYGLFEGYANRDSLHYLNIYNFKDIETIYRGTLRRPGFCRTWNTFVQLGATDDSYKMDGVSKMRHRDFINSFLYYHPAESVEIKLAHYMNFDFESEEMYRLNSLGLFSDELVGLDEGTPAQILEHILKKSWEMYPEESDRVVMLHKFVYEKKDGSQEELKSYFILEGEDAENTAMAKTVGLPLAIACEMIVNKEAQTAGLNLPVKPEWYNPLLERMGEYGVEFKNEFR